MIRFRSNMNQIRASFGQASQQFEQEARQIVARSTLNAEAIAKMRAPVQTGNLRSSIGSRFTDGGLTGIVEATAAHAAFVEYNTRAHIIRAKNVKYLKFKMNGTTVFRKSVRHPGTTAQPFMRPALEEERPHFIREITEAATRAAGGGS